MENNKRLRRRVSKLEALVATLTRTAEQQAKVIQQQAGMIEKTPVALEEARRARKRLRFGRGRRGRNRSVRDDLHRHATEYFTFLRQANVEATNYHAEQAIRPSVVNRKVWGGNRTDHGARDQLLRNPLEQSLRAIHTIPLIVETR